MKRPTIISRPVASQYQSPNERIVEFSHDNGGGLISIRALTDGTVAIDIYQQDSTVAVNVGDPRA